MDNDWNCIVKWENKRVDALRDGWTMTGTDKKSAKIRGLMH